MSDHHDFLNPLCAPETLDLFVVRRAILDAISSRLGDFRGVALDIGCGNMPYKSLLMASPSHVDRYIGLDLEHSTYQRPDLAWDGKAIPLGSNSVDCAIATEVFEHCPDPEAVMRESFRVLKPGAFLFFTVPFLWPLHDEPHDEYRYTPFALHRHLENSGFTRVLLEPLGGWDRSMAQMIGLWTRRRPMASRTRSLFSWLAVPIVRYLSRRDHNPRSFDDGLMFTGIAGTAFKPA